MTRRRLLELAGLAYPAWWRRRFGSELSRLADDLAAEGRSRLRLGFSIVANGVATRCSGAGMPADAGVWAERSKWLLAATLLPVVLGAFVLMWALTGAPTTEPLGRLGKGLYLGEVAASLAVSVTGGLAWTSTFAAATRSARRHRCLVLAGMAAPFLALALRAALDHVAAQLGPHALVATHERQSSGMASFWVTEHIVPSPHPLALEVVHVARGLVGYGGLVVLVVAVLVALRSIRPTASLLDGGVRLSRLMALSCILLAVILAVSGALVLHARPSPGEHLPLRWWPVAGSLAACAVVSLVGARAARRCHRHAARLNTA